MNFDFCKKCISDSSLFVAAFCDKVDSIPDDTDNYYVTNVLLMRGHKQGGFYTVCSFVTGVFIDGSILGGQVEIDYLFKESVLPYQIEGLWIIKEEHSFDFMSRVCVSSRLNTLEKDCPYLTEHEIYEWSTEE